MERKLPYAARVLTAGMMLLGLAVQAPAEDQFERLLLNDGKAKLGLYGMTQQEKIQLTGYPGCPTCKPKCYDGHGAHTPPAAGDDQAPAPMMEPTQDIDFGDSIGLATAPASAAPMMMGDMFIGGGSAFATSGYSSSSYPSGSIILPGGNFSYSLEPNASAPFPGGNNHTFKIADGQSVIPQDRCYAYFNYYNDLGINVNISRFTFGVEKLVADGCGSIGMRLPIWIVDPGEMVIDPDGTTVGAYGFGTADRAAFGDLTLIYKHILDRDDYGNTWTGGLALTLPTGPSTLGGVQRPYFDTGINHAGSIQPYLGGLHYFGDTNWFIHGFSAIDVPFDNDDATFWYNDIGIGQRIDAGNCGCLTAIIPTVELHINSPINNRTLQTFPYPGVGFGFDGRLEYTDQVNITTGCTFEIWGTSTLQTGIVSQIGNDRIYDFEFFVLFNAFGSGAPLAGFLP